MRNALISLVLLVGAVWVGSNLPPLPQTERTVRCELDEMTLRFKADKLDGYVRCSGDRSTRYVRLPNVPADIQPGEKMDCIEIHEYIPWVEWEIPSYYPRLKSCQII